MMLVRDVRRGHRGQGGGLHDGIRVGHAFQQLFGPGQGEGREGDKVGEDLGGGVGGLVVPAVMGYGGNKVGRGRGGGRGGVQFRSRSTRLARTLGVEVGAVVPAVLGNKIGRGRGGEQG